MSNSNAENGGAGGVGGLADGLFVAILAKDLVALQVAADAGENVNALNAEGLTPLALAVKTDFIDGISYLLGLADTNADLGKPFDSENPLKDDTSPLMIAAELDKEDVIKTLLGYPSVNINHTNAYRDTVLHVAIRNGSKRAFRVLLRARDINLDRPNVMNETPLYLAAIAKKPRMVEYLLQRGADVNGVTSQYDLAGAPMSVLTLAKRQKFDPVINRMIRNMALYEATYNERPTREVTPLESLEGLVLDVYPRTEKAVGLLREIGELRAPYPVHGHSVEESRANSANFLRSYSLVRHMCAGLEENYVAIQLTGADFYVTLSYGDEDKKRLLGFFLIEISRKSLLLKVICTRNTVKGAGLALMNFLKSMAKPGVVTMIRLDSVDSAKGFYARLDFDEDERKDKNYIGQTTPMRFIVGKPRRSAGASGASAGAGASGHGAGAGNRTRRNSTGRSAGDPAGGAGAGNSGAAGGAGASGGRRRKTRRVLRKHK